MKKYPFHLISAVVLTVLPLLSSSWVTYWVLTNEQSINQFGLGGWFVVTGLCVLSSVLALTPPTFLAIVFGYFLNWKAMLPLLVLNMAAILFINLLVRRIEKDRLLNYLSQNPKVVSILENLRKNEFRLIFFTKLSPVLPFALTNLVFALSGARLKNILLGGFLGMIPRTMLAIWSGTQAKEIRLLLDNPNEGLTQKIVIFLLVLVSVVGIFRVVVKALR